jgi:acetyltransferase
LFPQEAEHFARVNYQTRMAFVATVKQGDQEIIVGVARYETLDSPKSGEAEAAIVIQDAYQHQGLGAVLAAQLAAYGRDHGVHAFVAEISADNEPILYFIRRSGLPVEKKMDGNTYIVRILLV